jgi:hypothetical protein
MNEYGMGLGTIRPTVKHGRLDDDTPGSRLGGLRNGAQIRQQDSASQ